jgi:hypothetical protein
VSFGRLRQEGDVHFAVTSISETIRLAWAGSSWQMPAGRSVAVGAVSALKAGQGKREQSERGQTSSHGGVPILMQKVV